MRADRNGSVRCTVYHPFWIVAGRDLAERSTPRELDEHEDQDLSLDGRWVNSHELRCGDRLIGQDGKLRTVLKIEQEYVRAFLVHNLTIDEQHTFAVGPDAVLVHNTAKCNVDAIEQHHLLPTQFKDEFKARGLNPNDFKIPLRAGDHRLLPNGIHTGPYEQANLRGRESNRR